LRSYTVHSLAWIPTLLVGAGAIAGSLTGAYVARVLPVRAARVLVVAFGALPTAIYTWRYWL